MIKTKTLFILGAGASVPFGYPASIGLREAILRKGNDVTILKALNYQDDDPKPFQREFNRFLNEFARSSVYSIDSFLEYRTEFMEIGKINIAAFLINHEDDGKLRFSGNNWYMYLYDRLKVSFDQFDQNNISFITFNYDRSLEQFLYEAIRCRFGKSPQECAEKLKSIPIVHLYGQLDPLPWQGENGRKYSSKENLIDRLRAASKNIKLISDERDISKSEDFHNAYNLINDAQRIFFLGFSFDETNLDRLNIGLMKNKLIVGTALGLETSKHNWVTHHFRDKIQTNIVLHQDMDALSLLKTFLVIE